MLHFLLTKADVLAGSVLKKIIYELSERDHKDIICNLVQGIASAISPAYVF